MSKDAPSNAGELVCERDGEDVVMQPLLGRLEPRLKAVALRALGLDQHNPCRLDEQDTQVAIAAFRYLAEDGAVAGRYLLGDEPQPGGEVAAFRERMPAPIAATIALETIGPMPGTPINRSQPTSRRARTSISLDRPSMRPCDVLSSRMVRVLEDLACDWRRLDERADLIDDAGALTDQPLTHAVERLQVELLGGLGRDELHRRALHRLGDRLGVAEVVLLPP